MNFAHLSSLQLVQSVHSNLNFFSFAESTPQMLVHKLFNEHAKFPPFSSFFFFFAHALSALDRTVKKMLSQSSVPTEGPGCVLQLQLTYFILPFHF